MPQYNTINHEYDVPPFEHAANDNKSLRKSKLETQRRIYELKEKHRLRRENRSYLFDDYDDFE